MEEDDLPAQRMALEDDDEPAQFAGLEGEEESAQFQATDAMAAFILSARREPSAPSGKCLWSW